VVGANIEPADVVGQDQQDVRLFSCHHLPPVPGYPLLTAARWLVV
jgi:hypothetical protein